MMKKKLILHIGTEKTGTTTLQHFLQDNKNELLRQGVYIPQTMGALKGKYRGNHRKLATAFMSADNIDDYKKANNIIEKDKFDSWKQEQLASLKHELASVDFETVVMTSEHFSSRLITASEIKLLHSFLKEFFDDVEVVVYLRRQVEAAVSAYSTSLKSGYNQEEILSTKSMISNYDYFALCSRWDDVFKSIDVRVFDKELLVNQDICSDFMSKLSVDQSKLETTKSSNPSINHIGQRFLRTWNIIEPKYKNGKLNPKHDIVVSYLEDNYSGTGRQPMRRWVEEWMENFEESNDKVLKCYVRNANGRNHLFTTDYSKYPESNSYDVSDVDLVLIAQEVFDLTRKNNLKDK